MKTKEISKMSEDELRQKLNSSKKDLFNLRFRKVNGQVEDTSKFSQTKKVIAKILTKLKRKQNE